jgi:hypothetical protein
MGISRLSDPHPDAALLDLTERFRRIVMPEFERRSRAIEGGPRLSATVTWKPSLNGLVRSQTRSHDSRRRPWRGLRAKARVGLFPATQSRHARPISTTPCWRPSSAICWNQRRTIKRNDAC